MSHDDNIIVRQIDPYCRFPTELARDGSVDAAAKALYAALGSFAGNTTGEAWPSMQTLADMVGYSLRHTRRTMTMLRDLGWVDVEERDGKSSIYTLLPNPGHPRPITPDTHVTRTRPSELDPPVSNETSPQDQRAENERKRREAAEEVLRRFNAHFKLKLTGEAWVQRIMRQWPKGWGLAEWDDAILGLDKSDWWRQPGRKPDPGTLIGRPPGDLLLRHHQIGEQARKAAARRALKQTTDLRPAKQRTPLPEAKPNPELADQIREHLGISREEDS